MTTAVQTRIHPCHDCAFRADSPEMRDPWSFLVPMQEQIADGRRDSLPFRCHQGMPVVDGRYAPEPGKDYAVCAGFAREFAKWREAVPSQAGEASASL